MKLEEFASALKLDAETVRFMVRHGWDEAASECGENLPELQDSYILARLSKLRRAEDSGPLLAAARFARGDAAIRYCFKYLIHYWWKQANAVPYGCRLPELEACPNAGELGGALNLLVALAGFDAIENTYAKLGLPANYAHDSEQYVSGAIDEYRAGHDGRIGFSGRKLHWLRFYIDGVLFRLGRLEFMLQDPLGYLPAAYRRNADGHVIALCRHGWRLNREGLRLWESDAPESAYKVATLRSTDNSITGIPLNPAGFAEVEREITLDLGQYTPVWNAWDLVPGVHIPGGGRMSQEACLDAFQQATAFFPKYFGRKVAAFSCFSWIFNTDFERELPQSHLADLMRRVYLFPFPSTGTEGLVFVFGKQDDDWSGYPADNSLRKAFHRVRETGRRLKAGGMFIEARGLAEYSDGHYRKEYSTF